MGFDEPVAVRAPIAVARRAMYEEAQSHTVVVFMMGLWGSVLFDFEMTLYVLAAVGGAHSPWHNAQ
jgi:hypothetical protein